MAGLAAIRLARPDDFADLQRLNAELFKYENDLDRRTRNLNWPSTDFAVDYFHKAAEGRDGFQGFVAEAGGRVIGYLIADCFPKLYMAEPYRVVAELENMFIEANYRRSGVGSQLVEAYKTWAVDRGATYLRVGAWTSNHPAVAFYEKHGFAVIETVLERPIGGWHDKI